jgi:arylsulfatase A-like enzyme
MKGGSPFVAYGIVSFQTWLHSFGVRGTVFIRRRVGNYSESTYEYARSLQPIRTDRWKFICDSGGTRELYNFDNDPKETRNLAIDRKDLVQDLNSQLDDRLDLFDHAEHSGNVEIRQKPRRDLKTSGI